MKDCDFCPFSLPGFSSLLALLEDPLSEVQRVAADNSLDVTNAISLSPLRK